MTRARPNRGERVLRISLCRDHQTALGTVGVRTRMLGGRKSAARANPERRGSISTLKPGTTNGTMSRDRKTKALQM
jgi:hypothetical protein